MAREQNQILERATNNKNGDTYDIYKKGVINATNGHENDPPMNLYEHNGQYYVRDEVEFAEKFTPKEMEVILPRPVAGKLYTSKNKPGEMVIMCTGDGRSPRNMAGVVIMQNDKFSDFKLGDYSPTWTWIPGDHEVFIEYEGEVNIDNKNWTEPVDIGCSPG